jgi:hypothetical protein
MNFRLILTLVIVISAVGIAIGVLLGRKGIVLHPSMQARKDAAQCVSREAPKAPGSNSTGNASGERGEGFGDKPPNNK